MSTFKPKFETVKKTWMNYLQKIIDIRSTSDPVNAIINISESVSIKGYNMWLLFCSAVLASIGLDTNSTAVIIGAMLISPLMSPILGIGLALPFPVLPLQLPLCPRFVLQDME